VNIECRKNITGCGFFSDLCLGVNIAYLVKILDILCGLHYSFGFGCWCAAVEIS
jgi:hypothetical protein